MISCRAPTRGPRWSLTAFASAIGLALACDGGEPSAPRAPDAPDGAGETDAGGDIASDAPFGLDSRPANPTCRAPARPKSGALGAKYERVFPGLGIASTTKVDLVKKPGGRFYVVEQQGRILSFEPVPSVSSLDVVLDLTSSVAVGFEGGLLSLAFHPKFAQNGHAYVYYTRREPAGGPFFARVSRFTSPDGGGTLDPATEKVVLEFPIGVAGTGHTGGRLVFGPDGLLYFSTGDASIQDEAQRTTDAPCLAPSPCALHGKILRLDVDAGDPYAIPPSNPFAAGGGRKELYAWGFRNPFRFSFDRATGDLWLGDVGDATWEEIDRVSSGGNYGWPRAEGSVCRDPQGCGGLVTPAFTVHTASPSCVDPEECMLALVAGNVYRGSAIPELYGAFVYGDFGTGKQRALVADPVSGALRALSLNPTGPLFNSVGFTEDEAGEIFAIDFNGPIYALVRDAAEPPAGPPFPARLSATGCVDPADPRMPAAGVIPYAINAPFFSDGAEKDRFFAIPDGTTIDVLPDGDLDLPIGSVTMKTFRLGEKRIETRLFVRHDDGEWAGYSYEWNDAGTDATLLAGSKVTSVGDRPWPFPSRSECLQCHTKAAGRTLGLELAQLERETDYPGRPRRSQLRTLEHIGVFGGPLPAVPRLPSLDGQEPATMRARAMLHASCSGCHRPSGPTASTMDLRFATPLAATNTCDVAPARGDLGISGARLLAAGAPERSVLLARMRRLDSWRMPPLVNRRADEGGAALLEALVRETKACP
ncbi:MAG TPA: PQQ-dependent sugar dehydrogenase [Labilithrix sp.]|nr:PQQ-dependent sugar dehydrogenase [Labilithrix sp.]